jgi:hypothetical protein
MKFMMLIKVLAIGGMIFNILKGNYELAILLGVSCLLIKNES